METEWSSLGHTERFHACLPDRKASLLREDVHMNFPSVHLPWEALSLSSFPYFNGVLDVPILTNSAMPTKCPP